jgi:DNA-binding NarL/FixJ family response regulator
VRLRNCSVGFTSGTGLCSSGRKVGKTKIFLGREPMSASARGILAAEGAMAESAKFNGTAQATRNESEGGPAAGGTRVPRAKPRVFIAADNRLLREALARMLTNRGAIEVSGMVSLAPLWAEWVAQADADVLLLASRGVLNNDLRMIQQVRTAAPRVRILLLGMAKNEAEFLCCVRAGISGYVLVDASSDEVQAAVRALHAGEAVCPGKLCTALFRYLGSEAASMPCASAKRRLGLTRREQQLIPLIAKGLTNKEIANHFSLSEQTVKNHLYRMKHKTGAEDRLDIVQLYRMQGFLV